MYVDEADHRNPQAHKGIVVVNDEKASLYTSEIISYLPDEENYYPFYTVEKMVQLNASLFPDFCKETAGELIELMRIPTDQKISEFSKGYRGRVKILLTLARKATYILMDEPFTGLDTEARNAIIQSILRFIDLEKQTLLITTHDLKEVETLLETLVILRDHRLVDMIQVEEVQSQGKGIVEWLHEVYTRQESKV